MLTMNPGFTAYAFDDEQARIVSIARSIVQSEPLLSEVEVSIDFHDALPAGRAHVLPGGLIMTFSPAATILLDEGCIKALVAHEIGHYILHDQGLTQHDEEFAADAYAARIAGASAMCALLVSISLPIAGSLRQKWQKRRQYRRNSETHPSVHRRIKQLRRTTI